jgi:excisionase family DNA binding protein
MKIEENRKGLEHLFKKCPDVLTVLDAARWTRMSKNTIRALINEGKLTAYAYRGRRLISKHDLIEYLAATTDDEPSWHMRSREGEDDDE